MSQNTDVVVVGAGPGAEAAAASLARAGLQVVVVEAGLVGGECPYEGCIPSKTLIRAAELLADARRADGVAGAVTATPSFADAYDRVRKVTADWDDTAAVERLEHAGATLVRGTATVVGPRTVAVGEREWTARRGILLGVGTRPTVPPIPGLEGTPYWTNREILHTETLPRSLVVVGGGAIGLELAQAYARFGTEVTVVESAPRILAREEPEACAVVADALAADGITLHTGRSIESVSYDAGFVVTLDGGTQVAGEHLLVATGRTPNTDGLGLESLGARLEHGYLTVDAHQRVLTDDGARIDGLWAVGDVTGRGRFTHVSMYQSAIATTDILGEQGPGASYEALPRVTFTDPEVGAVGLTEEQARAEGLAVATGTADLAASSRGATYQPGAAGTLKLVVDTERGVLVGGTAAGPAGGEIVGALTVAIKAEVPVTQLQQTIWAYPTFHRAIGTALDDLS